MPRSRGKVPQYPGYNTFFHKLTKESTLANIGNTSYVRCFASTSVGEHLEGCVGENSSEFVAKMTSFKKLRKVSNNSEELFNVWRNEKDLQPNDAANDRYNWYYPLLNSAAVIPFFCFFHIGQLRLGFINIFCFGCYSNQSRTIGEMFKLFFLSLFLCCQINTTLFIKTACFLMLAFFVFVML